MSIAVASDLTPADIARLYREPRLTAKFEERPNGCWEWTACRAREGYGRVRWQGQTRQAHRVLYALVVGPIPEGLTLDHLCRNPACVNPAHLEPVPLRDNILRGWGVGVRNSSKTHCKRGHEFTPENTYWNRGKRHCRECGRRTTAAWHEKQRQRAAAS